MNLNNIQNDVRELKKTIEDYNLFMVIHNIQYGFNLREYLMQDGTTLYELIVYYHNSSSYFLSDYVIHRKMSFDIIELFKEAESLFQQYLKNKYGDEYATMKDYVRKQKSIEK